MASGMRRKIMQLCLLIMYPRMFFCGFVTVHKWSRVIGLVLHVKSKENPCGFEATENCVEVTNGAVVFPRERQSEKKKRSKKFSALSHERRPHESLAASMVEYFGNTSKQTIGSSQFKSLMTP